jgi:hypothetical protein
MFRIMKLNFGETFDGASVVSVAVDRNIDVFDGAIGLENGA